MSIHQTVTVTLSTELLYLCPLEGRPGAYADQGQVVSEGLRLLAYNEDSLEDWLSDDVVRTYHPTTIVADTIDADAVPRQNDSRCIKYS